MATESMSGQELGGGRGGVGASARDQTLVLWLINEATALQNSRNRSGLNNNGEPFSLSRGPIKGSWPPLVVHMAHSPPERAVCRSLLRRVTDWVTLERLNIAGMGRRAWHRFRSKHAIQRAAAALTFVFAWCCSRGLSPSRLHPHQMIVWRSQNCRGAVR